MTVLTNPAGIGHTFVYNRGNVNGNDFKPGRFTCAGGSVDYSCDSDGLLTNKGSFAITRNAQNGLPKAGTGGALNLWLTY